MPNKDPGDTRNVSAASSWRAPYRNITSNSKHGHSRTHSTSGHKRSHAPTIPTATAQLLTSTKALLQVLTAWASRTASVSDVSGKFVNVGDNFKALRKSYVAAGLEISDMQDIPKLLRQVLEESLVLEPSQQSLDAFLPRIGQIITSLMTTLKSKQTELQRLPPGKNSRPPSTSSHLTDDSRSSSTHRLSTSEEAKNSGNILEVPELTTNKDPLSRLQNNHALMRRASKRFSAYQTSKILSMNHRTSMNGNTTVETPKTQETTEQVAGSASPLQKEVTKNIRESEIHNRLSRTFEKDDKDDLRDSISSNNSKHEGNGRLYMKVGNEVKKVDIKLPTTVANIKVLFTQKFGYTPTGSEYPAIYVQDTPSDVAYEMENVSDISFGCILSLEQPDPVTLICQHLDEKMENMQEGMAKIQELAEQTKIDAAAVVVAAKDAPQKQNEESKKSLNKPMLAAVEKVISSLRFELGKARQQQTRTKNNITDSINGMLKLVQKLQAIGTSPNGVISDPYMDRCKAKVSGECESLVSRIDNLQDLIEVLKVDISKRRSRPSKKQLDHITKELSSTKENLESLTKYTVRERKNWNSRWQSELTAILEEQEFFKEQDTIIQLLGEDLGSADETFDLIVKCCDELSKNANVIREPKLPLVDPSVSINDAKSLVLQEVKSLNPNHQQRVDAIMKAEKVRNMERRMNSKTEFEQELGDFVDSGKLKDSGGINEVERKRQLKDEENLKNQMRVPPPNIH